jgi:hypothetical protein
LLDEVRPITPDGKGCLDPKKMAARESAIVEAALQYPIAVIVLGGAHDLSEHVRRLGRGQAEYIRVTPRRYVEIVWTGR